MKLARKLDARPHDPLARAAGQPRGAGVRLRRKKSQVSKRVEVGTWMPFAVALGVGLAAAAMMRSGHRG